MAMIIINNSKQFSASAVSLIDARLDLGRSVFGEKEIKLHLLIHAEAAENLLGRCGHTECEEWLPILMTINNVLSFEKLISDRVDFYEIGRCKLDEQNKSIMIIGHYGLAINIKYSDLGVYITPFNH